MLGVYIHIPYCEGKCYYCDFYSKGGSKAVPEDYINALLREIHHFSPCAPLRPDTVYFGGGTPSLLSSQQVQRILAALAPVPHAEITLEANPGTVTQESLSAYRSAGVNRLSLGIQTASQASLERIGRKHTAQQSREALLMARSAGFDNISGDLMLALPQYTAQELDATLDLLCEGGCTHISSYLLKIEPGTVFEKRVPKELPGEDAAADFYLAAVEKLAQRGFVQYEISNFARPGFESRHNLIYWNCQDYIGLGPAAHSCTQGKRFFTPPNTQSFLLKPAVYTQDGTVGVQDYIMLQLRLAKGLSLTQLYALYGMHFSPKQLSFIDTLCRGGFAHCDGQTLVLTPKGMLLQNSILCELI